LRNTIHTLRFLSLCFAYPNDAFLPALREKQEHIEKNRETFETLTGMFEQENNEQLQGEYTRLFITGYPNTPCAPYESVFLEGRMLGTCCRKIQLHYEEWGMTVDPGLVDHISTELEFLAFLASAATLDETREDARHTYHAFIQDHLSRWLPLFSGKLSSHAKLAPYRHLASLLETSIQPSL